MPTATKAANAAAAAGFTGRWTNPSNAYALSTDGTMATITNTSKNSTYGDDYGFPDFTTGDIPDGATINSVVVNGYWGHNGTLNGCVLGLLPRLNGADAGTEYTYTSSGGSPQWETFTPVAFTSVPSLAQLRSASTLIKARIRGTRPNSTNPATFELDFVSVTVDYSVVNTNANATLATATGAAAGDTAKISTVSSVATSTGTAIDATGRPGIFAQGDYATATGVAIDPTADTGGGTNAFADLAVAVVAAQATSNRIAASLDVARMRSS